jgi:hypothetical protein
MKKEKSKKGEHKQGERQRMEGGKTERQICKCCADGNTGVEEGDVDGQVTRHLSALRSARSRVTAAE